MIEKALRELASILNPTINIPEGETPLLIAVGAVAKVPLLIFAAFVGNYQPTVLWQWMVVLTTLVTSGALASGSLEYWMKNH